MGNSMPHYYQDHIAGKGENSLQHYNLSGLRLNLLEIHRVAVQIDHGTEPRGYGIQRNHQERAKEVGNISGSCYAL